MENTTDPLEYCVEECLKSCQIEYTRPDKGQTPGNYRLDFHLTKQDIYIEVKAWTTPRIHNQIADTHADGRTIVLVGMPAVAHYCALLTHYSINKNFKHPEN